LLSRRSVVQKIEQLLVDAFQKTGGEPTLVDVMMNQLLAEVICVLWIKLHPFIIDNW